MREINTGERNPFFGKTHTEETRYKMSESNSGKNHLMYGKNHSEETCIKMSESKMGENNPNFGKSFTEETRDRMSAAWTPERRRERSIEMSETRIGGNNPNWRGGSSFEPYGLEFNNDLREQIRNRDNYMCQGCNKTQEELGRKLNVHHIDYDKTNNKPENLICLCSSCHSKTNFDRENWIQYFRKLIGDL
jgi:group I intron endonuclease